ncbi:efflux RND transporter permease subunit [Halolactibacillus sp. JCM 19043]|uniref:efflux RND transporter permease subunit n=1 Tax=Halolactibacillus sp. JCM 19043 TaxID=1460638 RepID=UPI0009EB5525
MSLTERLRQSDLVLLDDVDTNQLYQNINQSVSAVRTSFPDDVRAVNINTDLIQSNVETFHIAADNYDTLLNNREAIHQFADNLTAIPGVKSTDIRGLPGETLSVQMEPDALARYQLQPNQVIETISRTIAPIPLGTDQGDDTIRTLTLSSYQDLDDFKATLITNTNGENVTLEDVASIEVITDAPSSLIHEDGQSVVSVTVQADDGINILNLDTPLKEAQAEADTLFSDDVTISSYFSQSTIIDEVYSSLLESLIISFIAVLVIMVLGLPITSAILVALAIPLSIIIGLIPLPYSGLI